MPKDSYLAVINSLTTKVAGKPRTLFGFPLNESKEAVVFADKMAARLDVQSVKKYFDLKYGHCVLVQWNENHKTESEVKNA